MEAISIPGNTRKKPFTKMFFFSGLIQRHGIVIGVGILPKLLNWVIIPMRGHWEALVMGIVEMVNLCSSAPLLLCSSAPLLLCSLASWDLDRARCAAMHGG
jgi:hypothetical protein